MIIQGHEHTLQRSGLVGEKSYGINLTSKMYEMLSSKLYTDRIGSVVREVCSNAWDAQKMRSIRDGEDIKPFKVTLPTQLEPHFIVEDSGPGMPDEQAQELYSTLGLSTKENTNDQIGAFGLGSKSPFAVSDTFTVENTHKGVTHFYLCFKAENGLPSLLKTGEQTIDGRGDGVRVIIPSPGIKYQQYEDALTRQLIAMEPKPIITNRDAFTFIQPTKMLEDENGFILTNALEFNLQPRSIYARMGMVLYPVDTRQANVYDGLHSGLKGQSALVLNFSIGDLEPLPSREGLTYDAKTIQRVKEKHDLFASVYKAHMRKQIESCETPLDAWLMMREMYNVSSINMAYEDIYVLGTPISNQPIKNVWPTFEYSWVDTIEKLDYTDRNDFISKHGVDAEGTPDAKVIKESINRTIETSVYFALEFTSRDLRINISRRQIQMKDVSFELLRDMQNKKIKVLLFDEDFDTCKYRVQRLKKWLSSLQYGDMGYIIHVDQRFSGSKTDFKQFKDSIDLIHPGVSAKFDKFSDIVRDQPVKTEKVKNDILMGISLFKNASAYSSNVRWSTIEALAGVKSDSEEEEEEEEVEDGVEDGVVDVLDDPLNRVFYIRATRSNLDDYPDRSVSDVSKMSLNMHPRTNIILVHKSSAIYIKRLEALGIREFKQYINDMMTGLVVDDDYRKYKSARRISDSNTQWMRYGVYSDFMNVEKRIEQLGEWVHPFFGYIQHIRRLVKDYEQPKSFQLNLISQLENANMFKFFKNEPWAISIELDITEEYNKECEDFIKFYPAFSIFNLSSWDIDSSKAIVNERLIEYIKDYNKLRGKANEIDTIIDYTEVLNSEIL